MKIGYARVSTEEQNLRMQIDELKREGCDKIFQDKLAGSTLERPQLKKAIKALEAGDTLVVWKLDRLSRSSLDFLHIMEHINEREAFFKSLTQPFDTSTPEGRLMMQMVATFSEYEREMIRERTKAGLKAAKARGQKLGRRPKLTPHQRKVAIERMNNGETAPTIARDMNVGHNTIYRLKNSDFLL